MDVASLRAYVRNHLEVAEAELPNTLLDVYLQDGFERTMGFDNRWPRNETIWPVTKVVDESKVALPADVLIPSIISVMADSMVHRLTYMSHENAEDMFTQSGAIATGSPVYWSVWGREMSLWPSPDISLNFPLTVRGYRQPVWSNAASVIPDLDERLHPAVAYYAMSLAYAAQEDEVLEGVYLTRWERDVRALMGAIMEAPRHRPLVLNGGPAVLGGSAYVIVPPSGS